jgi:hypothetical protein
MGRLPKNGRDEQYSEEEAQRRFLAAVKAGLNTSPKPLKRMTPKVISAQQKKKAKANIVKASKKVASRE